MSPGLHVIAEAGTNHGGDAAVARRLVDVAAEAGADSVKFQLIHPEGLYLPKLWRDGREVDNEVFARRRAAMLGPDDYRALAAHAARRGLPLTASVFDERGLDLLMDLDAPYVKVASCDLDNGPFLKAVAQQGRRVVLSTGMSTLAEIERAVEDVLSTGNEDLVLLHCVSVYPAPTARANVGFVSTLATAFGLPVGFSDHTESSVAAVVAVALGAQWIEKHYTLDRTAPGFDHAYAMEPESLTAYVADLRAAETALRTPCEKVGADEALVRQRARRALYAARDLPAGQPITEHDVLVVRPEGPLSPHDLPSVVGRVAAGPIRRYEPLAWELLA